MSQRDPFSGSVPSAATTPGSQPVNKMPETVQEFEELLQLIGLHVNPPIWAVRSGEISPVGTFPNKVAKLALFSRAVRSLERRDIILFKSSPHVDTVASYTLSAALHLEPQDRLELMKEFNELVKEYVVVVVSFLSISCTAFNRRI